MVNFKRYPEASGDKAVLLAKLCKEIGQTYHVPIIPVPQITDLANCLRLAEINCWTQKFEAESDTQKGTLLNHSDFRLEHSQLEQEFYLSRSRGDKICVCTASLEETIELLKLKPDYLAYEPPELIGSQTTSVAEAEPEVIEKAARACKQAGVPLLAGAGIKSAKDVEVSRARGAVGVILASAVVLATDPKQELIALAKAFA